MIGSPLFVVRASATTTPKTPHRPAFSDLNQILGWRWRSNLFDLTAPAAWRYSPQSATLRPVLILIKVQICQSCFKWRSKSKKNAPLSRDDLDNPKPTTRIWLGLVMRLWPDSLSSKDLLEACVAFAMGLALVIAFRWKR